MRLKAEGGRFAALALVLLLAQSPTPLAAQTIPDYGRPLPPDQARVLRMRIEILSRQSGVRLATLGTIARTLGANLHSTDFDHLIQLVEAKAGEAAQLNARIASLEAQIAQLPSAALRDSAGRIVASAQAAFNEGRLDDAGRELASLEMLRLSDLNAARAAWIDAVEARARVSELRLQFDEAADLRLAAMREERQLSISRQWELALNAANSLVNGGWLQGRPAQIERGVALYREVVLPLTPREERRDDWLTTQQALGIALFYLGRWEVAPARLEEAAGVFRQALEVASFANEPALWVSLQMNLADALVSLGARDTNNARLEQAVAIHRALLDVARRDIAPFDWATNQSGLGAVLKELGEREAGVDHLVEAVAAFRAALTMYDPQKTPTEWASAQISIGDSLATLGERQNGTQAFEEAIEAYQAALRIYTRQERPVDWVDVQVALGMVFRRLGDRQGDTGRLAQSVAAYRGALDAISREQRPYDWALTQNNLGAALQSLGARESETAHLEEASVAFRAALEEYDRARDPLNWAGTTLNLALAMGTIASRRREHDAIWAAQQLAEETRTVAADTTHGRLRDWYAYVTQQLATYARALGDSDRARAAP